MTAYLVTYATFMLVGGRLADVVGLRLVLVAGTLLYAAALVVVASAPSAAVLLPGARCRASPRR